MSGAADNPQRAEVSGDRALAVVLAGGLGTRFGGSRPKQLAELNGQPVLWHTLSRFVRPALFSECVIVGNPEWLEPIQEIVLQVQTGVSMTLVVGGRSRNESVWNAIRAAKSSNDTKCLVHDGVRPLATEKLIRSVLEGLDFADSVIPVIDAIDPLVSVENGKVTSIESRSTVFRGQSPQGFRLGPLRRAFEKLGIEEANKFSTIYEVLRSVDPKSEIYTVIGELDNIKITQPIDHVIAEELLSRNNH